MMSDPVLRLAINRFPMLRPAEKLLLEEIVDSERFFLSLDVQLLSQVVGRQIRRMDERPDDLLRAAEADVHFLERRSMSFLCVRDARYPAALREIYDPPYVVYLRGSMPPAEVPIVAVVGTREPSAGALRAAFSLCRELGEAGLPVVSGLARGIDLAAHQGALVGGLTGAVLACGIDAVCPAAHRGVARQILERGGFLMSEYAPGVSAAKYHFPARNRIISGLSRGVVIVQAPARSGALITADYALDHGRDLFVHRAGLDGVLGAGTAELASDGALIIGGASEILDEWGYGPAPAPPGEPAGVREAASSDEAGRQRSQAMLALLGGGVP